jgi:hypothetical protein
MNTSSIGLKTADRISFLIFDKLPKSYKRTKHETSNVVKNPMKTQNTIILAFLFAFCMMLPCIAPLGCASGGNGNQNPNGSGAPQGGPPQGPNNSPTGTGQQGTTHGGNGNQSDPQSSGYGTQNTGGGYQHRYRYQKRTMNIDGEGNRTQIRSQYQNNDTQEAYEIVFTIDAAPTLRLAFLSDANMTDNHVHFSLVVDELIEYYDGNGNGRYDGNDTLVHILDLSNASFSNITYTNTTTPDGSPAIIMETHTSDGIFTIRLYLVSNQSSFFNTILTPEEIKIDFEIQEYPFMNQSTLLALSTHVESPYTITPTSTTSDEQHHIATQESELNISSADHSGFFSWANEVIVDNVSHPVNTTVVSETEQVFSGNDNHQESHTQVIFSYPQGKSIVHDPKIGVVSLLGIILPEIATGFLITIYLLTCVIAAIAFYVVIYLRKKM